MSTSRKPPSAIERPPKKRATTVQRLPPRTEKESARPLTESELGDLLAHKLDLMYLDLVDQMRGMLANNDEDHRTEKEQKMRLDFVEESLSVHGSRLDAIEKAIGFMPVGLGRGHRAATAIPAPEGESA